MSARVDFIIIEGSAPPRIHHQRWGGGAVFATLVLGPDEATRLARAFDPTDQIDDIVAGCVIDHVRRVLVIAGSVPALAQDVAPAEHALLDDLGVAWAGWHLVYEPARVVPSLVHYVRKLGYTLRALNDPGEDDGGEPKYVLDAPDRAPRVLPRPANLEQALEDLGLSVRAIHELDHARLVKVGDVAGKSETELAALGLTDRVRRELFRAITI